MGAQAGVTNVIGAIIYISGAACAVGRNSLDWTVEAQAGAKLGGIALTGRRTALRCDRLKIGLAKSRTVTGVSIIANPFTDWISAGDTGDQRGM